jgi:TM2 domain-containing membrane protein YozV
MTSVIKLIIATSFLLIWSLNLAAQDKFEAKFNFAKELYDEEKYFDAVTEFKRLLFFDQSKLYSYEANLLIGLSYKCGAKYSDAARYFTFAELNATTKDELFEAKGEIIKVNIIRRTTARALSLLDSLQSNPAFKDKADEINYWRGWAYIFSDDWKKASLSFAEIKPDHQLSLLCDSILNDLYSPSLAKALSIVPGAGQFYTGEYVSGIISIGWNVLWGYLTINAFMEDRVFDGFVVGSLLWWRFYSGNLQNAEKFAIEKNLEKTNAALRYLQNNYSGNKP